MSKPDDHNLLMKDTSIQAGIINPLTSNETLLSYGSQHPLEYCFVWRFPSPAHLFR